MAAPKCSCPACSVVFDPGQSDGPVICPLCATCFFPGTAPPPAVAVSPPPSAIAPLVPLAELPPAAPVPPPRSRLPALALLAVALIVGGASLTYCLPSDGRDGSPAAAAQTETPPGPGPFSESVWSKVVQALTSPGPQTPPLARPTPRPPTGGTAPLPERINHAIALGTAYLKDRGRIMWLPCPYEGLLGLTLLECGVPPDDPAVHRLAESLRAQTRNMNETYLLATTIFFFDRLGAAQDRPRIRTLADRLLRGQSDSGTWTYHSPYSSGSQNFTGDHSNTQFAALALWIAQRHGVAVGQALNRMEKHFREVQRKDGSWDYGGYTPGTLLTSNTCAGLLGLALGHGIDAGRGREARLPLRPADDRAIRAGLNFLGQSIAGTSPGGRGALDGFNLAYTLWSIERTAVVYNLRTIGKQEWYPWAAEWLLTLQVDDGSWQVSQVSLGPEVETCFALLVLRRSNLVPDLTLALGDPFGAEGRTPAAPPAVPEEPLIRVKPGGNGGRVPGGRPAGTPERPGVGPGRAGLEGPGQNPADDRKRIPQ